MKPKVVKLVRPRYTSYKAQVTKMEYMMRSSSEPDI